MTVEKFSSAKKDFICGIGVEERCICDIVFVFQGHSVRYRLLCLKQSLESYSNIMQAPITLATLTGIIQAINNNGGVGNEYTRYSEVPSLRFGLPCTVV